MIYRGIILLFYILFAVYTLGQVVAMPQELIEKALDGDAGSQNSLGLLYKRQNDMDKALYWWMEAAKQEDANAFVNLGSFYLDRKDTIAEYWYRKAVEKNVTSAFRGLAIYYDTIKKDQDLAIKWFKKAAERGDVNSQRILGDWYHQIGNIDLCIKWHTKAAQNNYVDSMKKLADLYYDSKQYVKSFYWVNKCALLGDVANQCRLSYMYTYGNGVEINHEEARYWLHRSADGGYSQAQFNLGLYYSRGAIGLSKDEEKAFEWFKKAAQQGNLDAQTNIGVYYYNQNKIEDAKYWWYLAASNGNKYAKAYLKRFFDISM